MNHLGTKELQSERLILRRFKESDAKEIYDRSTKNSERLLFKWNKSK